MLCFPFLCEQMRGEKARVTILCLLFLLETAMSRLALPDMSLQAPGRLSRSHSSWWQSWGLCRWEEGLCSPFLTHTALGSLPCSHSPPRAPAAGQSWGCPGELQAVGTEGLWSSPTSTHHAWLCGLGAGNHISWARTCRHLHMDTCSHQQGEVTGRQVNTMVFVVHLPPHGDSIHILKHP